VPTICIVIVLGRRQALGLAVFAYPARHLAAYEKHVLTEALVFEPPVIEGVVDPRGPFLAAHTGLIVAPSGAIGLVRAAGLEPGAAFWAIHGRSLAIRKLDQISISFLALIVTRMSAGAARTFLNSSPSAHAFL
jgi:hypothetical protein